MTSIVLASILKGGLANALKYALPLAILAVGCWVVAKLQKGASQAGSAHEAELAATIQSKIEAEEKAADAGDTSKLDKIE